MSVDPSLVDGPLAEFVVGVAGLLGFGVVELAILMQVGYGVAAVGLLAREVDWLAAYIPKGLK